MKPRKRMAALALSLSLLASCYPVSMIHAEGTSAALPDDDWLHTSGNQILDKNNNPVWLTGCNWFGFNTGTNVFDGVWSCNMNSALKEMANRGMNLMRVPISAELINQWASGTYPKPNVNAFANPELSGLNSLEVFDAAVQDCKQCGIKIMIDIHSAKTDAMGHTYPVWYNGSITVDDYYASLVWIANRYKNDDTIIAIDLKNEPHGKPAQDSVYAKWDDSKDVNNWKYTSEQAASKIFAVNPNVLIMVEGIESYNNYNNWWGGNLRGVKDYPVNLGTHQDKLVYSPHDYGPLVYKQPWFKDGFTAESVYNDCWKDNWAYIGEQKIAPLLVGEWGGFMDGGDNEKWMEGLRDYMIKNKVSHTFWCYNANSGDTGGLVGYDFSTWDEKKYALVKPALWQNASGNFIGLDHQVPLGKDGLSLNQYYGGTVITTPTPPASTPNPGNTVKYGDMNGDGKINSLDCSILKSYLLGNITSFPIKNGEKAADVSGDGKINSSDYVLLKRFVLMQISSFPADAK
ncbi:MAG TPA: cellulase family glycosylhydrolase [Clostridia bacterium]